MMTIPKIRTTPMVPAAPDPSTTPRLCLLKTTEDCVSARTVEDGLWVRCSGDTREQAVHNIAGLLTLEFTWCTEDGTDLLPAVSEAERAGLEAQVRARLAPGEGGAAADLVWVTPRTLEGHELESIFIGC